MAGEKIKLPTIKDVARKADVSIATVSLVLHNHKRISAETKQRVNRAIEELNYHPSRIAQGLVSRKTGNIGFILTHDHFLRSEPFYTIIFLGTEFEARQHNYYVLLTTIDSNYKEGDRLPRFVLEKNVDGIIIAGKVPSSFIKSIEVFDLPTSYVDFFPSRGKKYAAVLIDNVAGGKTATEHLIGLGHKKIAFVGGDMTHPSINDRFKGYKAALADAGIKFDPALCITDEGYTGKENGFNAARKLIESKKKFTAMFACNDAMAIGTMQYFRKNNIGIPDDISLVGFDDVDAAGSLMPPLTTMRVPKAELGVETVRLLNEVLDKKSEGKIKKVVHVELVVRQSTRRLK